MDADVAYRPDVGLTFFAAMSYEAGDARAFTKVLSHLGSSDGSRVYFIGGETGPLKIGVSKHPWGRLSAIQTGNPSPLQVMYLIPGGQRLERAIHEMLADHRVGGEWFGRPQANCIGYMLAKCSDETTGLVREPEVCTILNFYIWAADHPEEIEAARA